MTTWRCSECNCTREAAERKRLGLRIQYLTIRNVTCTPECGQKRVARMSHVYNARAIRRRQLERLRARRKQGRRR